MVRVLEPGSAAGSGFGSAHYFFLGSDLDEEAEGFFRERR